MRRWCPLQRRSKTRRLLRPRARTNSADLYRQEKTSFFMAYPLNGARRVRLRRSCTSCRPEQGSRPAGTGQVDRRRRPPAYRQQESRGGAWKRISAAGLAEHAGQLFGRRVKALGRGICHLFHGANTGDDDQRQHHGILNSGWAFFFTQQFLEVSDHSSYSIGCCQPGLLHVPEWRRAPSGLCPRYKRSLDAGESKLAAAQSCAQRAGYACCAG